MSDTTSYGSLENQVRRLVGQWQKESIGYYPLTKCLRDFKDGLTSGEKLLGWISADAFPSRIVILMLLLTDKRLIVLEKRLFGLQVKSLLLDSITSVDAASNQLLHINEVARKTSFQNLTKEFYDKFITTLNDALAAAKTKQAAPPQTLSIASDPITQLERLADLKAKGILTEAEFLAQKQKVLGTPSNTHSLQTSEGVHHQKTGTDIDAPPIIRDNSKPPLLFDVVLAAVPAHKKIAVIKAVREVNPKLGLAEAKELVEMVGIVQVLVGVPVSQATAAKQKLEAAGASVRLDEKK